MKSKINWSNELNVLTRIKYRIIMWRSEIRHNTKSWEEFQTYVNKLRIMCSSRDEIAEGIELGIKATIDRDYNNDLYWEIRHSENVKNLYLTYMEKALLRVWDQFWSEKPDFRWELVAISDRFPGDPNEIDWTEDNAKTRRYWSTVCNDFRNQIVKESLNAIVDSIQKNDEKPTSGGYFSLPKISVY